LEKLNDDAYVVVSNFPFKFKFIYDADDGFCKFFKFQKRVQRNATLAPNIDYTLENIKEMVKPFSVIEWHCNITEYSYTNHDDIPVYMNIMSYFILVLLTVTFMTPCVQGNFQKKSVYSFKERFARNQRNNLNTNG
jgi:hypothetical protein